MRSFVVLVLVALATSACPGKPSPTSPSPPGPSPTDPPITPPVEDSITTTSMWRSNGTQIFSGLVFSMSYDDNLVINISYSITEKTWREFPSRGQLDIASCLSEVEDTIIFLSCAHSGKAMMSRTGNWVFWPSLKKVTKQRAKTYRIVNILSSGEHFGVLPAIPPGSDNLVISSAYDVLKMEEIPMEISFTPIYTP